MNKRKTGSAYEALAADFLAGQGLVVTAHNYRCRFGEIDLIAIDPRKMSDVDHARTCVFVEVKYRSTERSGQPWEAVGIRKRKTICRVADHYRLTHGGLSGYNFRFDIISILGDQITWFENAFPYTD